MPTFCRHGRFEASCGICRSEKAKAEPAPAKSSPARGTAGARRPASSAATPAAPVRRRAVVTGKLSRNADDGYASDLLPGVRSSADVLVLARELTAAEARLTALASGEGAWAAVAERAADPAAAFVAALTIAVASPDPASGSAVTAQAALEALAGIDASLGAVDLIAGASEVAAMLDAGPRGPRAHDASGAALAVPAAMAARSGGSLLASLTGEEAWSPERRFARLLDRLALKGLPRAVRFDILVALGRTGALPVRADGLHLGGDQVTHAAKRLFAVGEVPLLEKRAAAIVDETGVAWDALELALWNIAGADATGTGAAARWSTAKPATTLGLPGDADEELSTTIAGVLGA